MTLIEFFAERLGLSQSFVRSTINLAPHSYKTYQIKKKDGTYRTVHQPSKKVKALQALAISEFFSKLPVHDCVYSYRPGRSIAQNAEQHKRNNFLMRIDFSNFFESILINDIKTLIKDNLELFSINLNDEDINLLALLCCFTDSRSSRLRLVIGAPSSPSISNSILFSFDEKISNYCEAIGIIYTRYADDLYFSSNTPNLMSSTYEMIEKALSTLHSPQLSINKKKTYNTSKRHKKLVTGLVITPQNSVSIGREKKREIKSLVNSFIYGTLPLEKLARLKGMLSFVYSVEPQFIGSLVQKYGADTIQRLWKQ